MLHETISNDDISTTQRSNIVAILFWIVTTCFQHCNPMLGWKSSLRNVPCNITSKHKLYPFFCLDHGNRLQRKIMVFFFMSNLLYLNRRDFTKVPRYVCSTCQHSLNIFWSFFAAAPSLTNYYLLYFLFFGFNDILKWALSMSLLLLLGQTLSIKYV